jgi:hypothetical protein
MTFRKDWIKDLKTTTNTTITTANNEIVVAEGVGDVHIQFGDGTSGTIRNVLFIPGFGKNLLSIGTLTQAGYTITYTGKHAEIRQNGSNELIARARLENGLYKIQSQACNEYASIAHETASKTDLWHRRLGHIGLQRMQKLGTQIEVGKCDSLLFCKGCAIGKAKRVPFPKQSSTKTTKCGELIRSDVWGPSQEPSPSGSRYYVTFTDDYSRFRFVFFIKSKNEVLQRFKEITALIKQQHGMLGTLRSDNGGEYVSNAFRNFCNTNGIQQQFTVPYTPQQNGVAERANGTLLDMGRAMLFESGLSKTLWAEAVATACYLQNRLPTSKLGNKTPFEAWFNKKPSLDHLRIFGCNAYAHVPSQKRRKLDARAKRYIFVGYSSQSKGYRLWNSATKEIIISRDVTFDERWNSDASVFDGSVTEAAEMMETMEFSESELDGDLDIQKEGEGKKEEGRKEEKASSERQISRNLCDDINTRTEPVGARIETLRADSVGVGSAQYDTEDEFEDASPTLEPQQYVRPQRQRRTPTEWWKTQHFANIAVADEPRSYNEAIQSEDASEWKVAMDAELKSLEDNQTWKLCELPKGRSGIGCRWVLKKKLNADGTLRYNEDDSDHDDATEYRSAVGALIYAATGTRPDIANAVGSVSKFMEKPQKAHWDAVKRILRYLNGTRDVGLFYTKGNQELVGYSDSNYAGDLETRKSTTGYVFQMGTNTITWNSKRQQTVALSTCEAEYMALSHTVCEGIWTRKLLKELGFPQPTTTVHEDNQGCIALVKNPVQHHRTKHIDVKHHFIREQVEQGTFKVIYCPTHEMKADILTKGIAAPQFKHLRDLLNLRERKGI